MQEQARLAALHAARILDSPPEATFDAVARLAALTCETPLAFISLVDRDRLWFKAHYGSPLTEMSRENALCAAATEKDGTLVVSDIEADPRFSTNPVYREAGLRFYAGAPVRTREGHCLGTLCVLDDRPREFGADRVRALEMLAGQVAALIELHRTRMEAVEHVARKGDERLRRILDAMPDGVLVIVDGAIVYQNPAVLALTRRQSFELGAVNPFTLLVDEDRDRAIWRMREILDGGPEYPSEYRFLTPEGEAGMVEVRSRLIEYEGRKAILSVVRDVARRGQGAEQRNAA